MRYFAGDGNEGERRKGEKEKRRKGKKEKRRRGEEKNLAAPSVRKKGAAKTNQII